MATTSDPPTNDTAEQVGSADSTGSSASGTPAEVTSPLVTKLAGLRAKYLDELQAARDKVKQNFLR